MKNIPKEIRNFIAGRKLWFDSLDSMELLWNIIISAILFIIMFPLMVLVVLSLKSIY